MTIVVEGSPAMAMDRNHGTWLWILIPKLMIGPPLAFDPPYYGIFPPRWCWLRDPGFGEKSPFLMVESRRILSFCMVTWFNMVFHTQLLNFRWSRHVSTIPLFYLCWNHHRARKKRPQRRTGCPSGPNSSGASLSSRRSFRSSAEIHPTTTTWALHSASSFNCQKWIKKPI